jgi:enoyl-CoA hydratase/carnithine racemase
VSPEPATTAAIRTDQAAIIGVTGAVAEVVLNRPDRLNGLDEPAMDRLRKAFESPAARDDIRAVLLRGAGRAFCAGRDVSGVDPAPNTRTPSWPTGSTRSCGPSARSRRPRCSPVADPNGFA